MTTSTEVHIAGVPWPTYKLVALAIGALVLVVVGVATASAATAVLSASATAALIWLALGTFASAEGTSALDQSSQRIQVG
ncbi:hypothetical protein [Mycolicibacterium sp. 050158]|uniref:hypothetical protein n=1 Tax=Mycolicibacterium sp. 050158 TaxID=3090602 RepID=UPI00299E363F|nr:hypothetical protein [Mycolicibacterium sp. 050158]MDX1891039.1 hypothetical protein [Mycolicibacterium sp. 050158]